MTRTITLAACAAALFASGMPAQAFEGGVSAGPSLVTDGDVRIWGGTGRVSLYPIPNFGIEGEATVGISEDDIDFILQDVDGLTVPANTDISLDSQLGIFAVGRLPLESGSIFARLGYMKADFTSTLDAPIPNIPDVDVSFDNVAFGVGGDYYFNNGPHGLRFDITSITGDGNGLDGSIQTISLAYSYRFGG